MNVNRCINTGIGRGKPFLNPTRSIEVRSEIDSIIDQQIDEWKASVPGADHHERKNAFNMPYYQRSLAETALRIRLLRVVESKALVEIAKKSPEAAQIWADYERDEMLHDEMFIQDLEKSGFSRERFMEIEPTLSTKMLVGFFSYLLDHEGPLGVVAYSYLVEYVNVKLEPEKLEGLKAILGEELIAGQVAHAHTDVNHDHPTMVWSCLRYLISDQADIEKLKIYLREFQQILSMFFVEMNKEFDVDLAAEQAA
ncbi:hypothetical protein [Teredinibacter franksiae]|uniref:hypothetical protein n=1 Tax=Teredinibacter franksiae TaxID=2761453 RepID=UPI0016270019|nr:hypothetical protein [Teredinibacter franksiae]